MILYSDATKLSVIVDTSRIHLSISPRTILFKKINIDSKRFNTMPMLFMENCLSWTGASPIIKISMKKSRTFINYQYGMPGNIVHHETTATLGMIKVTFTDKDLGDLFSVYTSISFSVRKSTSFDQIDFRDIKIVIENIRLIVCRLKEID